MNSRTINPFTRVQRFVLTNWLGRAVLDVLKYGDGGVDVTGVPNCFEAEGAAKRRVFSAFVRKQNFACWELQFFFYLYAIKLVLADVNKVLLKIKDVITSVKQILIVLFHFETLPSYFLQANFTNFFSSLHFSLSSVSLCEEVNASIYPQWLVPSYLVLPQVSYASQSNENVANREMVLFLHPLYRVLGNQQLEIKSLTDTWQSDCANLLKSRKDTPRNFLIYAQLTAFFIFGHNVYREEPILCKNFKSNTFI